MKNTLCLFTNQYPFGSGEAFIETEIITLSERFEKVFIFPFNCSGEMRALPPNAKVIDAFSGHSIDKKVLFNHAGNFLKIFINEFLTSKKKFAFLKNIRMLASSLMQNFSRAEQLKKVLHASVDIKDCLFYSYWLDDWSTILSVLSSQGELDTYVSRAHRFDLYEELWDAGIIPFRSFQLSQAAKVFVISKQGADYLRSVYPGSRNKIEVSYLGVNEKGTNRLNEDALFTLVSCSFMVQVKRIDKIIDALALLSFPVRWIHFGGGTQYNEYAERIKKLPSTINCELKGTVENDRVIEFYRSDSVDLFINTSESEGLPVSIQEAISFGIPVCATNVGGVQEIVNSSTGFLLGQDPSPSEVAEVIREVFKKRHELGAFRSEVKSFWAGHFSAEKNYNDFCDRMNSL